MTFALRGYGPFLQTSPSAQTQPNCISMPITLDHNQIQSALKEFDIKEHDYYLLFDTNVYMVWCTTGPKALQLVTENSCVSLDYKGQWYYLHEIPDAYVVPSYTCVKYILAVN